MSIEKLNEFYKNSYRHFLGEAMNKMITITGLVMLMCAMPYTQADSRYAYEYSTKQLNDSEDTDKSDKIDKSRSISIKKQPYSQPNIMVYPTIPLRGNQDRYLQKRINDEQERRWREQDRDERYWRRRRNELENQPHSTYYENQFYRDDTHW